VGVECVGELSVASGPPAVSLGTLAARRLL